ncbi:hypothetical protein VTJ83DRAFT_1774 [Remersonia thermophila]|uniref:VLRF1 domain-containing protein n=1 Tax=Remersonia thermophila TaxID=72144 RepID=A0ABR4DGW9_9PEZI
MDKLQDALLRRPLYLYDLPAEILNSLSLKPDAGIPAVADDDASTDTSASRRHVPNPAGADNVLGSQSCSLCGMSFATVQEQRDHLKTDLHYYNLKQKMNGLRPVSEAEFEQLVEEKEMSISGSDTTETDEDEDDDDASRKESALSALLKKQASLADRRNADDGDQDDEPKAKRKGSGKPPLAWFSSPQLPDNTYFGVYRALFTPQELENEEGLVDRIRQRQLPPIAMPKTPKDDSTAVPPAYNSRHVFLCMIGGGHFAAMVVCLAPKKSKHGSVGPMNREAVVLAHKTFHRYTTRRKQGGAQSANDNAKGPAHSAGAWIRRYNEQALVDDVRGLLKDWKSLIDTSDLLFIRATGNTNRRTLFGPYEGQVLRPNDPRIRGFPFSTRRATQNELMRAFIELTRLKVKEILPEGTTAPADEAAKQPTKPKPDTKPSAPKLTEEQETAIFHTNQLQALIRRSKLPALLSYLTTNNLPPDFLFQPAGSQQNHHAPTPLHLAASQNSAALVAGLLTRARADPTILNREGRTPFELAGDRATRDAFRVARSELGEKAWDWEKARVPAALAKEEAERRAEREREGQRKEEEERRRKEEERLRSEGPKVPDGAARGGKKGGGSLLGGGAPMTAEERRQEEARGLTPEQRMRLERERRARAAEERIKRMQQQQGGG